MSTPTIRPRPPHQPDALDGWLEALRIRLLYASKTAHRDARDYYVMNDFNRVIHVHTPGNRYAKDGVWLTPEAGDLLLIPAYQRTRVILPADHREKYVTFQLQLPPAGDLLAHVPWEHCLVSAESVQPERIADLETLVHAYQSRELRRRLQGQARIIDLAQIWLGTLDQQKFSRHQERVSRLAPALQMVETQYAEALSLDDLAASCGLSRNYFCNRFAEVMGTTPAAYLTQHRMQLAAALLMRGSPGIAAVAEAVGYPDPYHFSRVFRKHFGHPPSRHRELAGD